MKYIITVSGILLSNNLLKADCPDIKIACNDGHKESVGSKWNARLARCEVIEESRDRAWENCRAHGGIDKEFKGQVQWKDLIK